MAKTSYKFGLFWERKPEAVADSAATKIPLLTDMNQDITTDPAAPYNILIRGDNYDALRILSFTHKRKIDLIYIDPPYNTGSRTWKYNNKFVDKDDAYKHSKWLSFMENRLLVAKSVLSKTGSVIIAIDDYEMPYLSLLLDKLFPRYVKDTIVVIQHPQGSGSSTVSRIHEYALILTPAKLGFQGRKSVEKTSPWSLKRTGQGENNWRKNRPNSFYAILVDPVSHKVVGVGPNLGRTERYNKGKDLHGNLQIYPLDKNGGERVWRYTRDRMQNLIKKHTINYTDKGSLTVTKNKVAAEPVVSVWSDSKYSAGAHGTTLLSKILGKQGTFPYPKSIHTVHDMLKMIIGNNASAIVLDFFAGSGTTGHALFQLNQEDNGHRTFILCTNNENKIFDDVCLPRIKNIITGYTYNENGKIQHEKGLGGNLKCFDITSYNYPNTDDLKFQLTQNIACALCARSACFISVHVHENYVIYKNHNSKHIAILFNPSRISEFIAYVNNNLNIDFITIYIFSYEKLISFDRFKKLKIKTKIFPIPSILTNAHAKQN